MSQTGNSNIITRNYLDSLLIETRYMNAVTPSTSFNLYGESFNSPIMTAALSHLDHFVEPGMAVSLARGAKEAGCVFWYGMASDEEIASLASTGARLIEIIKPYRDRELIYRKIRFAEETGLLAVGIDIDHPFGPDGGADIVDGAEMRAMTTEELRDICHSTELPVIAKGVLSLCDAAEVLDAGVRGMVISHHNNRIEYALPPLAILPEIKACVDEKAPDKDIPVFVDCMIQTGMDAFKAIALGASAVSIGRPLMTAYKDNKESGVRDYLVKARGELAKAMAFTGCADLSEINPALIHRLS